MCTSRCPFGQGVDMWQKTNEVKVFRDPIHGYVHVELQVIWDLINSRWFQRLRRIRQLGGAYVVYHCAEHTRFSHSLGVYEIVRRMVDEIPDIQESLNDDDKVVVMIAALLHDVGHGPYSHAFEAITQTSHEIFTCRIIEEDTEITHILERYQKGLSKKVADVIRHCSPNPLLHQLISSQLDGDRMDYLLRDAYFTGTKYGEFDLERILRTIRVHDGNQLVIKESGVYAVENYIMARYHMYWQIYYHPVARSYECILHLLFERLKALQSQDPCLIPVFQSIIAGQTLSIEEYFMLDEYAFSYGFEQLQMHQDPIVRDLSRRLRDRDLFGYAQPSKQNIATITRQLEKLGLDPVYYMDKDVVYQRPYVPYELSKESIWVCQKDGQCVELSKASSIVASVVKGKLHDDNKVFFPKQVVL